LGNTTQATADNATAFGFASIANHRGEQALSGDDGFGNGGAQTTAYVQIKQTVDATPIEMTVDGAVASGAVITTANRYILEDDTTYMFDIRLAARRTDVDNESAGYKISVLADRNAGTTALVGSEIKTIQSEDTPAWDVAVDVDAANNSLRVTVTGEALKTIRWVAFWRIVKVQG
jgi:hypothetical protein